MLFSKRSLEGQITIDHSASPGLPPGFMQSIGLDGLNVGEGKVAQIATLTCCHCGDINILNPDRKRDRGHCQKCDSYVCDKPECRLDCTPFGKTLDEAENKAVRDLALSQSSLGFIHRTGD